VIGEYEGVGSKGDAFTKTQWVPQSSSVLCSLCSRTLIMAAVMVLTVTQERSGGEWWGSARRHLRP